ncbi:monothiol glutaredoxin [Alteromonadaceae bacterium 2753L.S.0a.02]|nr:monothiol glutaredoxin [Alteromonadaceae bacterium 2753L.S.0a.02]
MATTEEKIRSQIASNPILLYMKGTPEAPECGYSGATVTALKKTGHDFAYVNVLAAPFIREKLPSISNWPTFPQLFVNGELVGGCDIVLQMVDDGSLDLLLEEVQTKGAATSAEAG